MPAAIRRYGIREGSRSRSKVEQRFSRLYIIYRGGFFSFVDSIVALWVDFDAIGGMQTIILNKKEI